MNAEDVAEAAVAAIQRDLMTDRDLDTYLFFHPEAGGIEQEDVDAFTFFHPETQSDWVRRGV